MDKPIRILHTNFTRNLGGIEVFIMNIYKHIDRLKVQFDFLDDCGGIYYKDEIEALGGKIIEIPTRRENIIEYRRILKKLMSSGEYAAVHCNCLSVANIDIAKIAYRYGKTRVIIHSHQDMKLRHLKSEILHRYNRMWLMNKDIDRFACSLKAAEWIHGKKVTKEGKVKIIPNAIEIEKYVYNKVTSAEYRKLLNIEDKLVIGCVGRFAYQKNHDFLLDVFYEISKKNKEAVLLLVGGEGGLLSDTKNKVKSLGLESKVIFTGIREDVEKLMQAMDIFILPSRWEGLGIVYIEAQAAGLLTIASSVVPKEAKLSALMHYISLDTPPEEWAKRILYLYSSHKRIDVSDQIRANGFDLCDVSEYMQEYYLGLRQNYQT